MSLTPPLLLTLSLIHLPLHLSFSLKHRLQTQHPTYLILSILASILQILTYTFLIVLESPIPTRRAYVGVFVFAVNAGPTVLTAAMAVLGPRVLLRTTTTTTVAAAAVRDGEERSTTHHTPSVQNKITRRLITPILLAMHAVVLTLQITGTLLVVVVGGVSSSPANHFKPPTNISAAGGENILRTSLVLHGVCIVGLGVLFGMAFFNRTITTFTSSSTSSSDSYDSDDDNDSINTFHKQKQNHNHKEPHKQKKQPFLQLFLLLQTTLIPTLLLIRTLYRCVRPLAGVPPLLHSSSSVANVNVNVDAGGKMVLFYSLDAAMVMLAFWGDFLVVVGLGVWGERGGGGREVK
ncbi:hypothetical protein DM02DRAFT_649772 [Periconia macrospinosa]|uniref:Uncharacterized protein n=1 Tax=Periconia macrospinosa TaxID=97972 RepID=A0A2V1E857_9PLEO|nr:hypothetical protein DM02DRAFT_649772 [Periconia macrospinosa]